MEIASDGNHGDNIIECLLNTISAFLVKKQCTFNADTLFEVEKLKGNDKEMVSLFNKLLLYLISVSQNSEEFTKKIKTLEVNEIGCYWNVVEMFGKFDGNNLREVPLVSVNEFDDMKQYLERRIKKLEKTEKDCKTIIEKHLSEVVFKENLINQLKTTIDKLEKQQKQNEIEMGNAKSEIDKAKEQNEMLQKELEDLKENNAQFQQEIISLKESNGQFQQVIINLNESNDAYQKEIKTLQDNNNSKYQNELQTLKDSNTQFQQEIQTLKDSNTQYQQELQTLTDSNSEYQKEIRTLKDSNTQYQQELQTLNETTINNYKLELDKLTQSNNNYQQQLQDINDNNIQLQQKLSEYEATTNQQQTSIDSLQNRIETLQKEIEQLTQANTNYQQQLQSANEANTQYQTQIQASNDNTALFQQKLSEYENTTNEQASTISSLLQELKQVRLQIDETSQQNQSLQNTITSLTTKPPLFISTLPISIEYIQTDSLSSTPLPSPILTETLFELASKLLN